MEKKTTKTVAKEVEKKETVKVAPAKAEPVKEEVKKAAPAKAEAKKPAAKKAPAKKAAAKPAVEKAVAKKEVSASVTVQFGGREVSMDTVVENVKKAFEAEGNKVSAIKELQVYVKPEEYAAYYVINQKFTGKVNLF